MKTQKPFSLMLRTAVLLSGILIPFSILSIIFSLKSFSSIIDTNEQAISSNLDSYSAQLSSQLDMADYLMINAFDSNGTFLKFVSGVSDWHQILYRNQIVQSFSNAMDLTDACDCLFLYVPERDELTVVTNFKIIGGSQQPGIDEDALYDLNESDVIVNGRWHYYEHDGIPYLIRIIKGANYQLGAYINLQNPIDLLSDEFSAYNTSVLVTNMLPEADFTHRVYSSVISPSDASFYCTIHFVDNYKASFVWIFLSFLLLIIAIAAFPLLLSLFRGHVGKPLLQLQNAFHELEKGNEDYLITATASSIEFEDAFNSFNIMAEGSKELRKQALREMQERYEVTEKYLNVTLDNLQLQIRPHFLQNTLNLLFTLIQNHQEENAKRLVLYLSNYFRYMFRYGHELELFDKEMYLVKEYLEISEIHYSGAFSVSYQINPLLSLIRIPPLLLHNFVENIIKHALIPGQVVHIIIYGEYDEDSKTAVIQLSDDGRGMDKEFAEMINTGNFEELEKGSHVGIINCINRLNYYYNSKASVHYDLPDEGGTLVTITIPYDLTTSD